MIGKTVEVLLVDDEQKSREHMRQWLLLHGFAVHAAATEEEAVSKAAAADFDVVLHDLKHRPPSDREAILRLRQINPSCEMIIVTNSL